MNRNTTRTILCDVNKLRQVLVNLVDNAIKYSPDGGDVEIKLDSGNGECLIEVADEGLGIPSRSASGSSRSSTGSIPSRAAASAAAGSASTSAASSSSA